MRGPAQEVAKQVKGIHYPLLVAAAYVGNAFCLVGISGTIALNVAGGWTFDGVWSTTGIPFRETVFAPYNLFIYLVRSNCAVPFDYGYASVS